MKKISYLLSLALIAFCASCGEEDNSVNQEVKPVSKTEDFVKAVAKGGEITLAPGAEIELNEALVITQPVIIIGDESEPAEIDFEADGIITSAPIIFSNVSIDAEDVTTPLIKLAEASLAEGEAAEIEVIQFNNCYIEKLSQQLIYANKQNYLVGSIIVDNSIIEIKGAKKKTIFDFNGGGNTEMLYINNSTIFADAATEWQNGGFFSSQSSKEVTDLGGEAAITDIENCTFYNIATGKTANTLRKNNQAYQQYTVMNNIIVNCGKKGQFLAGLAGGNLSKKENWTAQNNIINWIEDGNVEDLSEAENSKAGLRDLDKNIPDPCWEFRITTFGDIESGDFSQSTTTIGDPRWVEK